MITADQIVQTTCPYCGVGCQVDLHVKDGLIYRVNGRFDNPVNHGNLCVKGRFGFDFVHAPDRLRTPLLRHDRRTPFDDGDRATWDEALSFVAAKLSAIRDTHGPDSIAFLTSAKCTNEEDYLREQELPAFGGTNNVDHCVRL